MTLAVVTGSGGLVGAQTVRMLCDRGLDVVGVDNDIRREFFGEPASTCWQGDLLSSLPGYTHLDADPEWNYRYSIEDIYGGLAGRLGQVPA